MFYFAVWVKVHLETIIYQRLKASEAINLNQTSGYDRRGQASESEPAGRMPAHVAGLSSLLSLNLVFIFLRSDLYQCVNFRHVTLFLAGMAAA